VPRESLPKITKACLTPSNGDFTTAMPKLSHLPIICSAGIFLAEARLSINGDLPSVPIIIGEEPGLTTLLISGCLPVTNSTSLLKHEAAIDTTSASSGLTIIGATADFETIGKAPFFSVKLTLSFPAPAQKGIEAINITTKNLLNLRYINTAFFGYKEM
jgi:hypothetical protein